MRRLFNAMMSLGALHRLYSRMASSKQQGGLQHR